MSYHFGGSKRRRQRSVQMKFPVYSCVCTRQRLWLSLLVVFLSAYTATGQDGDGSGSGADTSPTVAVTTTMVAAEATAESTTAAPSPTPGPCAQCDPVGSVCGNSTNMTCMCISGYTGNGMYCTKEYVIDTMKNVATMNTTGTLVGVNTTTVVFGTNSTSSGEPWALLNTYVNLLPNQSIAELAASGFYSVRTCRNFLYSNGVQTQTCDGVEIVSTLGTTGIVGAIVDWVNMSTGGSENLFEVSNNDGVSEVAFVLPNITSTDYNVWVVEYRTFLADCQTTGAENTVAVCMWSSFEVNRTQRRASLERLQPGEYEIRLHAEIRTGPVGRRRRRRMTPMVSLYTPPIVVNVPASAPAPITLLRAHDITSQSLNISWQPPSSFNGNPLPYFVNFTLGPDVDMQNISLSDANETVSVFYGSLLPFTVYTISVIANSNGGSSSVVIRTVTTSTLLPGAVPSLNVTFTRNPSNDRAIAQLRWTPPDQRNGSVTQYEARYQTVGSSSVTTLPAVNSSVLSLSIPGLSLHSDTSFQVAAYTTAGRGPFTVKMGRTPVGVPSSPPTIAVPATESANDTSVGLLIMAAGSVNGPIQTYAILVSYCTLQTGAIPDTALTFQACTLGCQCAPYVSHFGTLSQIGYGASGGQSHAVVGVSSTTCLSTDVVCNPALSNNASFVITVRAYTAFTATGDSAQPSLSDFSDSSNNLYAQTSRVVMTTTPPLVGRGDDSQATVPGAAIAGGILGGLGFIVLFASGFHYMKTEAGQEFRDGLLGTLRHHSRDSFTLPLEALGKWPVRHDVSSGLHLATASMSIPGQFHKVHSREELELSKLADDGMAPIKPERKPPPIHGTSLVGDQYSSPIAVAGFVNYVNNMGAHSDLGFAKHYEVVGPIGQHHMADASLQPENRGKNRYSNIVAYEHSRVHLKVLNGEPGTSYINANYIHHPNQERAYIATQGPLGTTIRDFWRMVWEQGSSTVIMVTNLQEKGRVKCHQYWPTEGDVVDHRKNVFRFTEGMDVPLTVEMISEQIQSFATIRTFFVSQGADVRQVNQYHFTHWPDHGVPATADDLLRFVLGVRLFNEKRDLEMSTPIVVHCSAGVGRTGTYIAVDTVAQQLLNKDMQFVDLLSIACQMRWQRVSMIQTEGQFIYVHHCIATLIDCITKVEEKSPGLSRGQIFRKILEERYKLS
eukprot:scpid22840/ scgid10273/ Receptor-type tyrosine-protein phosphatase T; RPTPmam4; Receptor-type tyrosine-protein phosphatase rho